MNDLWSLFWIFAKIGVMTFGGGYAMLPMMQRELVQSRSWATDEELMDYFAIAQITPGVIAVNTATFVGYKRHGVIGGIIATFGVVFPSLVIISIIAGLINTFADLPVVQNAFAGIRACVCVLIFNAISRLWKGSVTDSLNFVIFLAVALASYFLDVSPAIFVLIAGVIGFVPEFVMSRKKIGTHKAARQQGRQGHEGEDDK
ncbi:MAG TPA: chromate transporter [Spirochaetales bacterium]|nr:chromate transporter [Spirochaetales bacterium]